MTPPRSDALGGRIQDFPGYAPIPGDPPAVSCEHPSRVGLGHGGRIWEMVRNGRQRERAGEYLQVRVVADDTDVAVAFAAFDGHDHGGVSGHRQPSLQASWLPPAPRSARRTGVRPAGPLRLAPMPEAPPAGGR